MKKTLFLEILRWVAVAAAVVFLISVFSQNRISSAAPETVIEAVTSKLDMSEMQEANNRMIKRLYGIDPESFDACVLYYPTTNMGAEELLIVKLADIAQQDAVRQAVEKRLDTQKTSFDGYGADQYDMLTNHSTIEIRGNYILFVVHPASSAAAQAFLSAL